MSEWTLAEDSYRGLLWRIPKSFSNAEFGLKNDMTYISVDEGITTTGKWTFFDDQNCIIMY